MELSPDSAPRYAGLLVDPSLRRRRKVRSACAWCHDRKVRCDASVNGSPCTPCRMNGHECVVRLHPSKIQDHRVHENSAESAIQRNNPIQNRNSLLSSRFLDDIFSLPHDCQLMPSAPYLQLHNTGNLLQNNGNAFSSINETIFQLPRNMLNFSASPPQSDCSMIFTSTGFLDLDSLVKLPPDDCTFLEMKGCFCVPTRPSLDELVRQYFLHVHPFLPVLNEAEFWDMYNQVATTETSRTISLFVFQAMLSASCAFVSANVIRDMGFSDYRATRNSFYRRAKLLFDLNAVNDPFSKAQGAVLLTYQSSSFDLHAGTPWLSFAIQNAMLVGAHQYHQEPDSTRPRVVKMKRLWWSILLRDRIMPLAVRRTPQINPSHFDLQLKGLDGVDLQDEVANSKVYDVRTKSLLASLLLCQCQFALVLTGVLTTVYSPKNFRKRTLCEEQFVQEMANVETLKTQLAKWLEDARQTLDPNLQADGVHDCVKLYTELTYMYYHVARTALCQHETCLVEIHQTYIKKTYESQLTAIRVQLEDATGAITKGVKQLIKLRVAHHLPIGVIAYIALPLLLSAVDIKFSSTPFQMTARERRLGYFAEVMRQLQRRYEVTDAVISFIKKSLDLSNLQKQSGGSVPGDMCFIGIEESAQRTKRMKYPPPGSRTKSWCEIFDRNPRFYLRLSLSLDHALARGEFPKENDLNAFFSQLEISDRSPPSATPSNNYNIENLAQQDSEQMQTGVSEYQQEQSPQNQSQLPFMFYGNYPNIVTSASTNGMIASGPYEQLTGNHCNFDFFEFDPKSINMMNDDLGVNTDGTWPGEVLGPIWDFAAPQV